jgi:hypothetical protein
MKLDSIRFGLSGGILWGVALFFMTLAGMFFDYGIPFLAMMTSVYPGFSISWVGAFLGLFYGFLDGFIGLWIFAYLYNWLER